MLRRVVSGFLLLLPLTALADEATPWSLTVDALGDSQGSQSLYFSAAVQAGEDLWLYGGWGEGEIQYDEAADIRTESQNLGFSHYATEHWGWGLTFDHWEDTGGIENRSLELAVNWRNADWRFELAPGVRDVTLQAPDARGDIASRDFDDRTLNLNFTYSGVEAWRFYLSGTQHSYDPEPTSGEARLNEELGRLENLAALRALVANGNEQVVRMILQRNGNTRLLQILNNQGLAGLNRLLAYQSNRIGTLSTVQALTQGLTDDQLVFAVTREFGLHELSYEYASSRYAVDGLPSETHTLRYLMPVGDSWDLMLQSGVTRTEGFDSTTFYGVSLTKYF